LAVFYWAKTPSPAPASEAKAVTTPSAPVPPSARETPPVATPPPSEPAISTNPPDIAAPPPAPVAPATGAAPPVHPLQALRQRLREQMRAGDQQQILDTLVRGLGIVRDDPDFSRELNNQYQKAANTARTAQTGADQVNARRFASAEYEEGQRSFQEATRMPPGRRADAARTYLTAANAVDPARALAQTEAPRIQTAPPPP